MILRTQSALQLAALPLLALFSLGFTDCTDPVEECAIGDGGHFESLDALDCGLGPDGIVYCPWDLLLHANGSFEWYYSDVVESGSWTCDGEIVTGTGVGGRSIPGSFDVGTELLTWDGIDYSEI